MGIVLLGCLEEKECEITQQLILIRDQVEVDRDRLLDSRVLKAFGDAFPVGFIGDFLADCGQVILGI
jgi:hypothetical protein